MEKSLKYLQNLIEAAESLDREANEKSIAKGYLPFVGESFSVFHLKTLLELIKQEYEEDRKRTSGKS